MHLIYIRAIWSMQIHIKSLLRGNTLWESNWITFRVWDLNPWSLSGWVNFSFLFVWGRGVEVGRDPILFLARKESETVNILHLTFPFGFMHALFFFRFVSFLFSEKQFPSSWAVLHLTTHPLSEKNLLSSLISCEHHSP